ncbi:hypothetical protein PUNSTDRAFT_108850 [Punctularia strigosozonata HHB-11173 SS5]|uniref:Mucoidy inhibitor A n=1 Tax=Punctularia strigosozonata (strain HHB-11173) TaxID=741275 RepID=R7S2C7_PUNST|nr:uncharacterized protein PUNSTDRAFT_108850 [Punctularia strigosozonata HHB-11173 SS5]EIN04009.1 hypothetical protein PUNSTDRAFT_108850 [Punctularia strigosozonata HHB-11173 SS5]
MVQGLVLNAADHPIKSVTIFKTSKAEVVRTFKLDLKVGQNRVEVTGLPSCMDTDSVRVTGLGDARLFDVICTITPSATRVSLPHSPAEQIRRLEAKRKTLESMKHVREHEEDILTDYGKSLRGEHVSPADASSFLDGFIERAQKNLEALAELDEAIVQVNREIHTEKERAAKKKGDSRGEVTVVIVADQDGPVELKLTYIVANASWESTYDLYATTDSSGQPAKSVSLNYRARVTQTTGEDWVDTSLVLSTASSDMSATGIPLLRGLRIDPAYNAFRPSGGLFGNNTINVQAHSQKQTNGSVFGSNSPFGAFGGSSTNQAPSGTSLFGKAATTAVASQQQATTGGGLFGQPAAGAGGLFGAAAQVQQYQVQPVQQSTGFGPFGQAAQASRPADAFDQDEDESVLVDVPNVSALKEPTTVVSESPLSLTYSVDGKSSVPSDGLGHQVSVASLPFECTTTYVSVPRAASVAYLQCSVRNTSDYQLLPGPVNVFLDETFVSKTRIRNVDSKDTFGCTLGIDYSLAMTYVRRSATKEGDGGAFAEKYNSTTYTVQITVKNKHRFPIKGLVLRDSIPTAAEAIKQKVRVILRKPDGLADASQGETVSVEVKGGKAKAKWAADGEKDGKYDWVCDLEPGKELTLETVYEVRAPADMAWNLAF